ncbi:hypothetical protein Bwad006_15400 [Bilophila wadsworthia]|jgi:hypothetical protein
MPMGSTGRIFTRKKNKNGTWSPWSSVITDSQIGDGITNTNGIIPVPEVISSGTQLLPLLGLLAGSLMRVCLHRLWTHTGCFL